jgi:hypothetical protein
MTVDKIGLNAKRVEIQPSLNSTKHRLQIFRTPVIDFVEFKPSDVKVMVSHMLITKTPNFHRKKLSQFLTQVFHMNTRSTIDIGWVFVTEHQNFHVGVSLSGSVDKMLHH